MNIFKGLGRATVRLCVAVMLGGLASGAYAGYSCTTNPTGISVYYDSGTAQVSGSSTVTVTCNRDSTTTDANTRYVDLGLTYSANASGGVPRVASSVPNYLNYNLWRTSTFSGNNGWTTATNRRFTGTINFGSSLSGSITFTYYLTVPSQTAPKATYTDNMTVNTRTGSAANNATQTGTNILPVTVIVPETCVVSSPPGNINLTYTSFQTTASSSSTSVAVRCTPSTNFTLTLDNPVSQQVMGLNYSLSLSFSGGAATGVPQNSTITATIPAGQSGTCSIAGGPCTGSQTRTLTLSY